MFQSAAFSVLDYRVETNFKKSQTGPIARNRRHFEPTFNKSCGKLVREASAKQLRNIGRWRYFCFPWLDFALQPIDSKLVFCSFVIMQLFFIAVFLLNNILLHFGQPQTQALSLFFSLKRERAWIRGCILVSFTFCHRRIMSPRLNSPISGYDHFWRELLAFHELLLCIHVIFPMSENLTSQKQLNAHLKRNFSGDKSLLHYISA